MENTGKHIDPIELLPKYLAGEATASEIKQVDDWRAENAEHVLEFEAFAKLWNASGPLAGLGDIDLDAEWSRMQKAISPARTKTFTLTRLLQVAAAVIFITILSFIGIKYLSIESHSSSIAQQSVMSLPDGSVISLNAGSKISYKKGFGKTHRNLILKGEAYFEVTKNADLPFIISANEASIRVVGTKFNVKAYKNNTEVKVLVTEGTVKLYETRQAVKEITLNAGESGSYNKSEKVVVKKSTSDLNDIAWKTLIIEFNNTPLSEVAEVLVNTYHTDIVLSPDVKDCPITVNFTRQDLPSVLKVLKSTLDLKIVIEGKQIIITGAGC